LDVQQIADQRRAISAFRVGRAPSATLSIPEVVQHKVSVSLGIVGHNGPGTHEKTLLWPRDILLGRSRRDFESEPGSIPVERLWRSERLGASLLPWSLPIYFCQLIPRVSVLVFPLVSAAIDDENYFKFKWLGYYAVAGQGHQAENINRNNDLNHWFDSIFLEEISRFVENTGKN
jgi:hypothetical protein